MEQSYDVLKFVTDGRRTHIGVDCVRGILLVHWVQDTANKGAEAERLRARFAELADMLAAYHRCQISESYQYLSPFSVVAEPGRDGKWHLLDTRSMNNQELMKLARRRDVRTAFLPVESQFYQGMDEQTDLYSFGRLMQFVLCKISPDLKHKEGKDLQKIILWCLETKTADTTWLRWVRQLEYAVGQKDISKKSRSFQQTAEYLKRLERKRRMYGSGRSKQKK